VQRELLLLLLLLLLMQRVQQHLFASSVAPLQLRNS
jgi:hypothetical protein